MPEQLKMGPDKLDNEFAILTDLGNIMSLYAEVVIPLTRPYKKALELDPEIRAMPYPRYMAHVRMALSKAFPGELRLVYPAVNSIIVNGVGDDACLWRLHDAIFHMKDLQAKLEKAKYLIKSDEEAERYNQDARQILGDVVIFTIEQFGMYDPANLTDVSVNKYCLQKKITVSTWYAELIAMLNSSGVSVYGYEPMSGHRAELYAVANDIISQMEEEHFPLDAMLTNAILRNEITLAKLDKKLVDWRMSQRVEAVNSNIVPQNLMSAMKLED